jgi:hypothetical protein
MATPTGRADRALCGHPRRRGRRIRQGHNAYLGYADTRVLFSSAANQGDVAPI